MTLDKFGRYEIRKELGRGGMATVYHAFDPRFKRDVALKVLPPEFLRDSSFIARFEREAQIIATLEHPAIVPVYDFGEENGQLYLVMRFLTGGSLADRLEKGPCSFNEAGRIINHLAPAIDAAHKQGVIHRDLKPDNILFDQWGAPYIADFGIAKVSEGSGALTTSDMVIGTPAYMSPEQANGEKVDGRADIYALGVVLFEMLTGKLPYNAATPLGLLMKHISEPIPDILKIKPDLPPTCRVIITRAMAKKPGNRYATATALAAAFSQSTSDGAPASLPQASPTPSATEFASAEAQTEQDTPVPCPNCQTTNPVELRFCANCGHQIKLNCPQCYTVNRIDALFCVRCKADLRQAQAKREELEVTRQRLRLEREQALKEKEIRQQQEKIQRLVDELGDSARYSFAIYQLKQLGDTPVNALLEAISSHPNPPTRARSVKVLNELCDQHEFKGLVKARVVKILIKALADPELEVRYWAANTLSKFEGQPGQPAVEPLGRLLKDPSKEVRQQALFALQRIGGPRAQEILDKSKGLKGWLK